MEWVKRIGALAIQPDPIIERSIDREYDDPAWDVDQVLDNVTVGDLGRLPDGVAERAMRAYLRLIANMHAITAPADARYVKLALQRYGLWDVEVAR